MSCCAPETGHLIEPGQASISAADIRAESRDLGNDRRQVTLSAPQIHCGACISTIEDGLRDMPGVLGARVNLTARRLTFDYAPAASDAELEAVIEKLASLGYAAHTEGGR
jgi:P-type Cu2+ transporter